MTRNKLLLLLALLLTAATGAWGMQVYISYPSWPSGTTSLNNDGNLVLEMEASDSFENMKAKIQDKSDLDPTCMHLYYNGTELLDDETLYEKSVGANSVLTLVYVAPGKHLITATYDEQTRSLEQPLPYATTIGELYEAVTGKSFSSLLSTMSALEMPLTGISSTKTDVVSIGDLNGASTPVTVKADGKATVGLRFGNFVQGIFVNVVPPLYAYMKDGVKDADKWTVKVGEGQAQALPIGGLKGGETVTLQYNGRLKVKGVKATSDAAPAANPNAYLKWDATKKELVEAEIPAGATTVTNADAGVNWAAGTYVVEGDVEINGKITLNGNVDLIIKDGAKLTAKLINGADHNLSIYGQANQTGQLVVNCSDNDAISRITTLEVHSCQVTATSSNGFSGGFYAIGTFNVYGGLVDAKNTGSSYGYGIYLADSGSMNIYGGEVKAEGKGNLASYSCGIRSGTSGATVTVYGGKLWAGSSGSIALENTVTLTKDTGYTSGKIETSDDGSSWTEYTTPVTPDAKYVRVGY